MNNKRTLVNTIMSLVLQFVTILSGFIIPKLILNTFGSDVNGLISSLNQFLNYINLFEGGLNAVILSNLYKPLVEKNYDKVSSICVASISFYRKLALFFLFYTMIIGMVYPIITQSPFTFSYIFSLTLILSLNMFTQYCFSITYRTLLKADRKVYLVSLVQILFIVINTISVAVMIKLSHSIHLVKLITMLVFFIQPLIFNWYIKKNYPLNLKILPDNEALKQRWNGFGINLAAFIHNNTDIVILTIFSNLKTVSIYSVYLLVTQGLKNIITSISAGIVPSIGHLLAEEKKAELNKAFDDYEFVIFFMTAFLFTVGGILITPFVMIYTKGITDTNYYQPLFGVIMIVSEAIFCIREPYVNMAYSGGKFKEVSPYAFIEAGLNIILSLLLVSKYGIMGVALATAIAMMFRTIVHVIYLKYNILYRPLFKTMKKILTFGVSVLLIIVISHRFFSIDTYTVYNWIIYALKNGILALFILLMNTLVFYKNELSFFVKLFKIGKE